jgi:hypothetical protein
MAKKNEQHRIEKVWQRNEQHAVKYDKGRICEILVGKQQQLILKSLSDTLHLANEK